MLLTLPFLHLSFDFGELTFPEEVKNKKSSRRRQKALIKDWILSRIVIKYAGEWLECWIFCENICCGMGMMTGMITMMTMIKMMTPYHDYSNDHDDGINDHDDDRGWKYLRNSCGFTSDTIIDQRNFQFLSKVQQCDKQVESTNSRTPQHTSRIYLVKSLLPNSQL